MKIAVIPGRSMTAEQMGRWTQLQEADPAFASPFLSPEFTQAVAAVRDDVYVALLEEGGEIVGFFPYQRGWCSVGRPVGGLLNDLQGVVVQRGVRWDAAELIRRCNLLQWTFSCVRISQETFAPFHLRRDFSWMIDISHGYDTYVAEKRDTLGPLPLTRKMRRLEREAGPLRFEPHSTDAAALAMLMKWKANRYARRGYADVFAVPWVRRVLERIHETQTARFGGMLSVLYAGDEIVAAHMGLRSHSVWHGWFTSYAPRFARYSPGLMLFLKMAEAAPKLGLQHIELGGGEYSYKGILANSSIDIAAGTVDRLPLLTTARRWQQSGEDWIRRSRLLRPPARTLLRTYRRLKQRVLPA
jgi:CelD/BcsL family acetyltransferase involved in cellulose biosynthesis